MEIQAAITNITDGVGGMRTTEPVGFEKRKNIKGYVLIFAEWNNKQKISLRQKNMPLGEQGWESTLKDDSGNYVIDTDGIMVKIYKDNIDARLCYRKWTENKNPNTPLYWASVTSSNYRPNEFLRILDSAK